MTQAKLNQEVAAVTGESVSTVRQLGIVPSKQISFEQDPDLFVVDWDEVEQSRTVLPPVFPCTSYATDQHDRLH